MRSKHPNKDIEAAVKYAESIGWRYKEAGGSAHAWGRILCSYREREGCSMSIWSTPKNPFRHAKQIKGSVKRCPHKVEE